VRESSTRQFDEADERLNSISKIENQPARIRRAHLDLTLQNSVRKAEYCVDLGRYDDALHSLEHAKKIYASALQGLVDYKTLKNLNRARRLFPSLRRALRGTASAQRLAIIEEWLPFPNEQFLPSFAPEPSARSITFDEKTTENVTEPVSANELGDLSSDVVPRNRGRLVQIHQNYAFIDTSGVRHFFHRGSWVGAADFTTLAEGSIVEFDISTSDQKIEAVRVMPVEEGTTESLVGRLVSGAIKVKSKNHGFIKLDRGGDVFFHRLDCGSGTSFNKLSVGDRVRIKVAISENGKRYAEEVELYSGLPIT
jgi:cold shock CspA family protein